VSGGLGILKPKEIAMRKFWCSLFITLLITAAFGQRTHDISPKGIERIAKEVRHEILLLPYYGVFDILGYKVDPDGSVTLTGSVTRPTVKSDAENVIKKIEGVEKVNNQINVLPPSPNDDRIRRAAFNAIYGYPALNKYAWESVQSIHIIVNNGALTLEGQVDNEGDKNIAEIQAKGVPGAFSAKNNLKVGSTGSDGEETVVHKP
jgi:hyperosmotically inducible protein